MAGVLERTDIMKQESDRMEKFKDEYGRTRYKVKGSDGWNLVTNDRNLARKEAESAPKAYGEGRICR